MESIQPILTPPINQSLSARQIDKVNLNDADEQKKIQAAKDFESVLINSIPDSSTSIIFPSNLPLISEKHVFLFIRKRYFLYLDLIFL